MRLHCLILSPTRLLAHARAWDPEGLWHPNLWHRQARQAWISHTDYMPCLQSPLAQTSWLKSQTPLHEQFHNIKSYYNQMQLAMVFVKSRFLLKKSLGNRVWKWHAFVSKIWRSFASEEGGRETSKPWMMFAGHCKIERQDVLGGMSISPSSNSNKYVEVFILGYWILRVIH